MPKSSWVCISISRPWSREEADHVVGVEGVENAERVAEAQAVGALFLGGLAEAQQELEVGARGVLGVHRHVQAVPPWRRPRTRGSGRAPTAATWPACARCGCRWPTWRWPRRRRRSRWSAGCREMTARFQARIEGLRPSSTICAMAAFSSPQHGRDADLDLVHADLVQQARDADLLVVREDDAGGLLAVAQGGVVDAHRRAFGRRLFGDDEARQIAWAELAHAGPLRSSPASAARTSSPTSWGLPLPWVAFMT